ncbi:MAG TPA: hypothetical protein VN757_09855 [Steroidobacteraceae bacterium]|nr:hypothetical protein [Steroidobacteraceae bacterium]
MKWLLIVCLGLLQIACAAREVRCDGALQPINAATAAVHGDVARPAAASP